ncbi:alpha/beta hydrolase [Streptomyces qinglanensis]|uniref:Alpha/beta hydrolase n=1 Tax=Streptomyces qinglanensis TaxID=943816 RepID=A0A1H9UJV6_9ACTN|nr:alpha/beta hydrolase [Streptomyces qinglanensis]SES09715.1 Alpha/beta hydrolase [Streptomyces qinglanensis]
MKYQTLAALEPADLDKLVDGYRAASDMGSHAKDKLNDKVAFKMREYLSGAAAQAATRQVGKLSGNFHYAQAQCGLIRTNIQFLKEALEDARKKLKDALASAETEGVKVNPDGSVTYPAAGEKDGDGKRPEGGTATGKSAHGAGLSGSADKQLEALDRQAKYHSDNPKAVKAQEIADDIAAAVHAATKADQTYAPVLRRLKADDDLNVSNTDWADTKKDTAASRKAADEIGADLPSPPKDGSPKDNKSWWDGLSQDDKDSYIALRPNAVGSLDGLPSDARDEANRMKLAETKGTLENQLSAIPKEPEKHTRVGDVWTTSADWRKWNEKYGDRKKALNNELKGIDAIQARFDKSGKKGLPQAYLLGFDAKGEGDGKVILANGNPDEAKHTVVHVPGTTTNMGNIGGTLNSMDALWAASHKAEPNQSVSTITWFDYDPPDDIPQYVPNTGNTSKWAEDGAPALQRFVQGAETAQGGADASHTTVSGHSYGSTVVGQATKEHGGLPADDIMVQGSPGMQVKEAKELGVGPEHVWSVAAPAVDDTAVREGGRLMGLGDSGKIPNDPPFGANRMDPGDHASSLFGHSSYWDQQGGEPSKSLNSMANVAVGHYDNVDLLVPRFGENE